MDGVEFSTMIESDAFVVVDRALWWPRHTNGETWSAYGSHVERAVTAPALQWYFAEGATHSGFNLFYLLQNPTETTADVRVRYGNRRGACNVLDRIGWRGVGCRHGGPADEGQVRIRERRRYRRRCEEGTGTHEHHRRAPAARLQAAACTLPMNPTSACSAASRSCFASNDNRSTKSSSL
jgi:hypothetical protein